MFYPTVLFGAFISFQFWTAAEGACPPGWERFKDSCYMFAQRETSWNDALADCVRRGSTLVKIESLEENTFLRQFLTNTSKLFYGYDMWLGAHVAEVWKWVDGAPMDPHAYNDWESGKPASTHSNVCLEFESDVNNHWNDDYCDELNYHICERPFNPLTPPPLTTKPAVTTTARGDDTTPTADVDNASASSSSSTTPTTTTTATATRVTADNSAPIPANTIAPGTPSTTTTTTTTTSPPTSKTDAALTGSPTEDAAATTEVFTATGTDVEHTGSDGKDTSGGVVSTSGTSVSILVG